MELMEAIKERRSIRSYNDTPVEKETLFELMEAGMWAPTASNAQTWRFVLVTDAKRMKKITMISPGMLGNPPAAIVICQDLKSSKRRLGKIFDIISKMDSACSSQNIMLAAHEKGLGTCVIASFHPGGIHKILSLPEYIQPQLIVSIGHIKKTNPPPKRKIEGNYWYEVYNE